MERGCSRVARDVWLWNRKSPGGCEIETGFGNQATGKLCHSSSKWIPLSNQGRIRQGKERDGLRLSSTVAKIQRASNPYGQYSY